jgi:hypothetical protein
MPYRVGLRRRLVSFLAGFPKRRSSRAPFDQLERCSCTRTAPCPFEARIRIAPAIWNSNPPSRQRAGFLYQHRLRSCPGPLSRPIHNLECVQQRGAGTAWGQRQAPDFKENLLEPLDNFLARLLRAKESSRLHCASLQMDLGVGLGLGARCGSAASSSASIRRIESKFISLFPRVLPLPRSRTVLTAPNFIRW